MVKTMRQQLFTDRLQELAEATPRRTAVVFLGDGENETERVDYATLYCRARQLAVRLQQWGCAGQRVLLAYPSGIDYLVGFLACLYGGATAVPAYPAGSRRASQRMEGIVRDCHPVFGLTTPE